MKSLLAVSLVAAATCGGSKGVKLELPGNSSRPNPYRMIVTEPDGTLTTYDVAISNNYAKSWKLRTLDDETLVFFFVNANGRYDFAECSDASLSSRDGKVESGGSAYRKYDRVVTGDDPEVMQGSKKAEALAILFTPESLPQIATAQTIHVCDSKFPFTDFDREVVRWFAAKHKERPATPPEAPTETSEEPVETTEEPVVEENAEGGT